jgi:hypothetical protein
LYLVRRCLLLFTLVCLFTTGCLIDLQAPTDEQIWQAYVQTAHPDASNAERLRFIEAAKQDFSIERLGVGDAIAPQPALSGFCLPDNLRQQQAEVRGRSYLVHLVSKQDRKNRVSLDFTRWEGANGWWMSSVTFKGTCFLLPGS